MTLTMESWTLTVQPSQTSTNSRTALRTRRWARRDRDSGAWNTNTPVTTASSTARIAMFQRASCHASTQAGHRRLLRHQHEGRAKSELDGHRDAHRLRVSPAARRAAVDQELQPPRLERIELRIGRQREQPGILLRPDPVGGAGTEPLVVVVGEGERLVALHDADAVEPVAFGLAKMLGADEVVGPVGGDENRRSSAWQAGAVFLEISQAQQVAADGRGREQAGEELDIGLVRLAERHVEGGTACARRGERRRNLARRDAALRHRARGHEVLP